MRAHTRPQSAPEAKKDVASAAAAGGEAGAGTGHARLVRINEKFATLKIATVPSPAAAPSPRRTGAPAVGGEPVIDGADSPLSASPPGADEGPTPQATPRPGAASDDDASDDDSVTPRPSRGVRALFAFPRFTASHTRCAVPR